MATATDTSGSATDDELTAATSKQLHVRGRGGRADRGFHGLAIAAGALVLVVLVGIVWTMTVQGWDAFELMGIEFITSDTWNPPADQYGALAFIYGTVVIAIIAILLAVPVSVGIALFITQVVPARFRQPIIWTVDLLAVIPSVVFGLWGILVLGPNIVGFYDVLHNVLGGIPLIGSLFGEPTTTGRAFMTAGIILAIMITPIVTSLSREVIDTTPPGEREGALALGCTRWEMIRGAVIPHSKGGIVGAVMLGLGRAMGETIAVALVIGSSAQITANLFAPGDAMPAVIVNQWPESSGVFRSALIALAVVLFLLTVIVNMTATWIVNRSLAKTRGI